MNSDFITYCLSKKGAIEDYPFGPEPLVIKVGGKMFALISKSENKQISSISLKCDPLIAENLREQHSAVQPGYHLNKKHWNTVTIDGSLNESDLQDMINHSYDLVVKSLPKSFRVTISEGKVPSATIAEDKE